MSLNQSAAAETVQAKSLSVAKGLAIVAGAQRRHDPRYIEVMQRVHDGAIGDVSVEFEYANGARSVAMCREWPDCYGRVSERVIGTKGVAMCDAGVIRGENPFRYEGPATDAYIQEQIDMIESIRKGNPINEGRRMAESNLTAIMGRMSAYTGLTVDWEWALKRSRLDLAPPHYTLGALPVAPVAMPGQTELL
jgi:predicted dehydrogenase